jgi:hypothetical protein
LNFGNLCSLLSSFFLFHYFSNGTSFCKWICFWILFMFDCVDVQFKPKKGLWVYNEEQRYFWFNPNSLEDSALYKFIGVVFTSYFSHFSFLCVSAFRFSHIFWIRLWA